MTRIGLSALVASLAIAAPAAADPAVTWTAPAACPDASHFAARVAAHLGDPAAADGVPVEVTIAEADGGFALTLRTEHGERSLASERCADVVEAAALIVAMALEPDAGFGPEPAPQRPVWATDGEVPPGPPQPEVTEISHPFPRIQVAVRGAAGGDVGMLPGAGVGAGLTVAFDIGRFRVEVGGYAAPARAALVDDAADITVSMRLLPAALCWRLTGTLLGCVAGEVGEMRAELVRDGMAESSGSSSWAALGPAAQYRLVLSKQLNLHVEGRVGAALVNPGFGPDRDLDGVPDEITHQAGWVHGRLMAGLELVFP